MDAPDIIWLQRPCRDLENEWYGSTTWCGEQQNDDDTKYIRADKLASLEAENARLVELAERAVREMNCANSGGIAHVSPFAIAELKAAIAAHKDGK